MLLRVLDELDLFRIAVESSLHRRSVNLFPFFKWKEDILLSETPYHDLVFPISLEYRSFVVLQELLEIPFVVKSDVKTLVEVSRFRVFVKIKMAVGLCREIVIERFRLAVNPLRDFCRECNRSVGARSAMSPILECPFRPTVEFQVIRFYMVERSTANTQVDIIRGLPYERYIRLFAD